MSTGVKLQLSILGLQALNSALLVSIFYIFRHGGWWERMTRRNSDNPRSKKTDTQRDEIRWQRRKATKEKFAKERGLGAKT